MAERENLPVPEEPDFNLQIGGLQPDDPVHFAQMNNMLAQLLTNDAFLEKLANKMIEKALVAHVLDSSNSSMVLGADQAPALTALIDAERERITQLYSDLDDMIITRTFSYSQTIRIGANYGQEISIPYTLPDGYIFLCVVNVKSNEEAAYAYFNGLSKGNIVCYVGNDCSVQKTIPKGISADVLFMKKRQ